MGGLREFSGSCILRQEGSPDPFDGMLDGHGLMGRLPQHQEKEMCFTQGCSVQASAALLMLPWVWLARQ